MNPKFLILFVSILLIKVSLISSEPQAQYFANFGHSVKNYVQNKVSGAFATIVKNTDLSNSDALKGFKSLVSSVQGFATSIGGNFEDLRAGLVNAIADTTKLLGSTFEDTLKLITFGIPTAIRNVKGNFDDLRNNLTESVYDVVEKSHGSSYELMTGLIEVAKFAVLEVEGTAANILKNVTNAVNAGYERMYKIEDSFAHIKALLPEPVQKIIGKDISLNPIDVLNSMLAESGNSLITFPKMEDMINMGLTKAGFSFENPTNLAKVLDLALSSTAVSTKSPELATFIKQLVLNQPITTPSGTVIGKDPAVVAMVDRVNSVLSTIKKGVEKVVGVLQKAVDISVNSVKDFADSLIEKTDVTKPCGQERVASITALKTTALDNAATCFHYEISRLQNDAQYMENMQEKLAAVTTSGTVDLSAVLAIYTAVTRIPRDVLGMKGRFLSCEIKQSGKTMLSAFPIGLTHATCVLTG